MGDSLSWQIIAVLWGLLLGLIGVIWAMMLKRVEALESGKASSSALSELKKAVDKFVTLLSSRASQEDMSLRRADIKELFARIEDTKAEFNRALAESNKQQAELASKLAKIEGRIEK